MTHPTITTSFLFKAILDQDQRAVETALLEGANSNYIVSPEIFKDKSRQSLLMYACHIKCHEAAFQISRALLLYGADINYSDSYGFTPLEIAVEHGHDKLVELLFGYKNNIDQCDHYGHTPLFRAIMSGHVTCAQFLCEQGANIHARDNDGNTPLVFSIKHNQYACCEYLITQGSDVNERDNFQLTPLLQAASYGRHEIMRLLLDQGADIHHQDLSGNSVLHTAIRDVDIDNTQARLLDIITLLLERGSDLTRLNNKKLTPLDLAKKYEMNSVVELINNFTERTILAELMTLNAPAASTFPHL